MTNMRTRKKEEIREILPEREYIALGSTRLDDLDEVLHLDIESQDYDSIGGYIIEQLDRFPEKGESRHNRIRHTPCSGSGRPDPY